MRVPVAMMAEYATTKTDGGFYVVAGGFDSLECDHFPYTVPHISIALKLILEPVEQHGAIVTLRFIGPDDQAFVDAVDIAIRPVAPAMGDNEAVVSVVYNLVNVALKSPGRHTMTVSLAGHDLSSCWFTARSPSTASPSTVGVAEYQRAFEAFGRGDLQQAETLFHALVGEMPLWGLAHNALGFVLLARDNPSAALDSFREAERLQATAPDLLQMNMGCCRYLMGAFADAIRNFQACLHRKVVSTPAILMAIVGDGLEQVSVVTPGEYVMLASLNAGWSALRLRDQPTAERHLNVARASMDPETTSQTFMSAMAKAEEALADLEREA
jgi:hypothetical protein